MSGALAVIDAELARADASALSTGNALRHSLRDAVGKAQQRRTYEAAQARAVALRAARAEILELLEAGAQLRTWSCAVIEWYDGDWRIHDEDENIAWLAGSHSVPSPLAGYRGDQEGAKRELMAQRSYAAARWDAALEAVALG